MSRFNSSAARSKRTNRPAFARVASNRKRACAAPPVDEIHKPSRPFPHRPGYVSGVKMVLCVVSKPGVPQHIHVKIRRTAPAAPPEIICQELPVSARHQCGEGRIVKVGSAAARPPDQRTHLVTAHFAGCSHGGIPVAGFNHPQRKQTVCAGIKRCGCCGFRCCGGGVACGHPRQGKRQRHNAQDFFQKHSMLNYFHGMIVAAGVGHPLSTGKDLQKTSR